MVREQLLGRQLCPCRFMIIQIGGVISMSKMKKVFKKLDLSRRDKHGYSLRQNLEGYSFISLFVIGFMAFTVIPIGTSLVLSFTKYDILSPPQFIGLKNYIQMFTGDKQFWVSFSVTLFYVVVSVPLRLAFALGVAMLLQKTTRLTTFYRAAYYLPSIIGSSIAISVVWRQMFGSDGMLNSLINSIFGTNIEISWIGGEKTAIWTLIILAVWQYGSSMLIFLSGLKQIPKELYEAAEIDGATRVHSFFRITIPMLTPVIFFNMIMQLIQGFMTFTQSYVITQGMPMDKTLFITVYVYRNSFTYYKMGYGCAIAWFLLMFMAVITALLFKSSRNWVFYQAEGGD